MRHTKLYEIPRNSKILLPIGGPNRETKEEMCTFLHIDGMYSAITTESGAYVHLGASTEVTKVGDHYELAVLACDRCGDDTPQNFIGKLCASCFEKEHGSLSDT